MTANSVRVRIQTEAGPLAIVGTERGVSEIYFDVPSPYGRRRRGDAGGLPGAPPSPPSDIPLPVRAAIEQLEQYLQGQHTTFDFAMQFDGSDFQRRVWSHLLTIPPGETETYGQVARAVGKPKAARAVGGAVGSNPISIVIPCHRVVAADGKGGGYGGGMAAKRLLLQIEGVLLPDPEESPNH